MDVLILHLFSALSISYTFSYREPFLSLDHILHLFLSGRNTSHKARPTLVCAFVFLATPLSSNRVKVLQGYLRPPLGPHCRTMPRALWGSEGGGCFLMSEVPLYWTTLACLWSADPDPHLPAT